MAVAQMMLYSEPFRPSKGLDLDPSSIPDRRLTFGRAMAHLLPYSVSGDFLNGGTSVEYRPGYWFVERAGIGVPLSPIIWQSAQGGQMLVAAGIALLLHFDSVLLPEVQIGPRLTQTWEGLRDGAWGDIRPGAEVAAYLFAGKLRLSVGVDDFGQLRRHASRLVVQARPRRSQRPDVLGASLHRRVAAPARSAGVRLSQQQ